jgi:hypothetical protein
MRALFFFLLILPLTCAAKEGEPHVFTLGDAVSITLPAGWAYVQKGKHGLVGPEGAPLAEIGYVEIKLNLPVPIHHSDAAVFVQNNLKIATCEDLDGDRVLGHIAQRDAEVEHHYWNIATVIDEQHIAVLLIGMETGIGHPNIVSVVDQLARSARFVSHKPKT